MKFDKINHYCILIFSAFFICSCSFLTNFQIPKKISVTTDAAFSVSLGKLEMDLSEQLNSDSILSQMQENLDENTDIYNLENLDDPATEIDENDILTYLIHCPVYEIPVDVTSYLSSLDFDDIFSDPSFSFNFNQNFAIDPIQLTGTKDISADISEIINGVLINQYSNINLNLPIEEADGDIKTIFQNLGMGASYDSIEIESAAEKIIYTKDSALNFVFKKTDENPLGNDFEVNVNIILVEDKNDIEGSKFAETGFVNVKNGETLSIDIGKDVLPDGLPEKFYIVFEGDTVGSNDTLVHGYNLTIKYADNTSIDRIENITKTTAELGLPAFDIEETVIPLDALVGTFESATVKKGKIYIESVIPGGWENIVATPTVNLTGCGFSNPSFNDYSTSSGKLIDLQLNLENQEIDLSSESQIVLDGQIEIEVFGANIDLSTSSEGKVSIVYGFGVDELKDVVIDLTSPVYSSIKSSFSLPTDGSEGSVPLPKELLEYVKKITFGQKSGSNYYKSESDGSISSTLSKGIGISCKIINSLPCDIPVSIESNILNINKNDVIQGSTPAETLYTWNSFEDLDFSAYDYSVENYIDFSFQFASTTLTLGTDANPFVLGTPYELALSYDAMLYDWDSVVLNSSNSKITGDLSFEALNITSILSQFLGEESKDNLNLNSMPVYFYAQKPELPEGSLKTLIDSMNLNGQIYLSYIEGDNVNPTIENLLGDTTLGIDEDLQYVKKINWIESGSNIKVEDEFYTTLIDENNYSFKKDMAPILKKNTSGLKFIYDIALSGDVSGEFLIRKAMIDELSEGDDSAINIKIDMCAAIPFDFSLIGDVNMDLMSLISSGEESSEEESSEVKDLFNRESADSTAKFGDYCGIIDSFRLNYTFTNNVINGIDLKTVISDTESQLNKEFSLSQSGTNVIDFTGSEIKKVLTSYPFNPNVNMVLKGGTEDNPKHLTISRKAFMGDEKPVFSAGIKIILDFTNEEYITIPLNSEGDE